MEVALPETWQCEVALLPSDWGCALHVMQSLMCLSTLCILSCPFLKRLSLPSSSVLLLA